MINIFAAQTANASSASFSLGSNGAIHKIGVLAWGTWATGSLTLEVSPDGGTTWIVVGTYTANKSEVIEVCGTDIRATLAAGTAESINLDVAASEVTPTRVDS